MGTDLSLITYRKILRSSECVLNYNSYVYNELCVSCLVNLKFSIMFYNSLLTIYFIVQGWIFEDMRNFWQSKDCWLTKMFHWCRHFFADVMQPSKNIQLVHRQKIHAAIIFSVH